MRTTLCQKACEFTKVTLTTSNGSYPIYYECCKNCGRLKDVGQKLNSTSTVQVSDTTGDK